MSSKGNVGKIIKELNYENYKLYGRKLNGKVKKSAGKIRTKTGDTKAVKRKESSIDYITSYPLLRCSDKKDCSALIKYAGSHLPSVTNVINETMPDLSKFYLERWKKKMISELGEEGFLKHQQETFNNGSNLHANIEKFLSGIPEGDLDINDGNVGHWRSLGEALGDVNQVIAMEKMVQHRDLCYQGKFDCIAVYRNTLCVIDWKTSKKIKPSIENTFDNPLQIAAYIGAINNSQWSEDNQLEEIQQGVIIVAYPDGNPAHVHVMDHMVCLKNWKRWLNRLHLYWKNMLETSN